MSNEENIQQQLTAKFPFLSETTTIRRVRRIWVETPADRFQEVFTFVADDLKFGILCTITGQDEGENFSLTYHLAQESGIVLNLRVKLPKANPVWKTIIHRFPGGELYEREIADMFGVQIEGLPTGDRYPLPDGWPVGEYPLRKDWKPKGAAAKGEGPA